MDRRVRTPLTAPEPIVDTEGAAPDVSVVMPVRNDAAYVAAAVDSALGQDYAGHIDVVIGLAPSDDGTAELVRAMADADDRIRVVPNPGGGTAAGLNAAIAATSAPVLARVDAHCELPADYVATAVTTLMRTGAANVGGVQRATGTTPYQRAVAAAMTSRFGVGDAQFHYGGSAGPTDTVYLGVFRAEALQSVGGFDESLVRNQDYELNIRLREAGHQVWFEPALEVRYQPRTSPGALASQYFGYGQWKREVVRRHPQATRARHLVAPATLLALFAGGAIALTGRRWGLLAPAGYASAVVAAAATAEVVDPSDRVRLLGIFPTMHLAWAAGFFAGPGRRRPIATAADAAEATLDAS